MPAPTREQMRKRAAELIREYSLPDHADFAIEAAESIARDRRWPECATLTDNELTIYCAGIAASLQSATITAHWLDGGAASSDPDAAPLPTPPASDHIVDEQGHADPEPFDFDFIAAQERHYLRVREHWNDTEGPWPLERLAEYLKLADTLPGHAPDAPRWQETNARVIDLRALFTHVGELQQLLSEARELASQLLGAGQEIAEDRTFLSDFDPDLAWERLPFWLTTEAGAPEEWETPERDAQAQQDAADVEYDPDLGKDLDYDDEPGDES